MYRNRSLYKSELGELGEGRVDARRAVEVVEQADLLGEVASHCRVLAGACYELGAWQEARAALRKARSHVPGSTDSLLAWLEGDFAGSIQLGHAEVAGSRRKGDIQSLVGGLWALGDSYLQLDRLQEADMAVREAAAAVRQHGYVWFMGVVYATQAEIAVRAETTDVEAILAEAERTLDRSPRFLGRLTLLRAKGTHLANTGDLPGAVAILQAGADTARTHGALVDLARMLAHLAEMAPAAGNVELAASAEAERAAIVAQIGPEVRGLTWARGLP